MMSGILSFIFASCEPLRQVDSTVLRSQVGHSVCIFFLIKQENDQCKARNLTQFLFGMSLHDVPEFKVHVFTRNFKFLLD